MNKLFKLHFMIFSWVRVQVGWTELTHLLRCHDLCREKMNDGCRRTVPRCRSWYLPDEFQRVWAEVLTEPIARSSLRFTFATGSLCRQHVREMGGRWAINDWQGSPFSSRLDSNGITLKAESLRNNADGSSLTGLTCNKHTTKSDRSISSENDTNVKIPIKS